jgi:hypothetical protein
MRWLAIVGLFLLLSSSPLGVRPALAEDDAPQRPAACGPTVVTPAESYPETLLDTPPSAASHCTPSEAPPSGEIQTPPNCDSRGAVPTHPLAGPSPTVALQCARLADNQPVLYSSEAQPTTSSETCQPINSSGSSNEQDDDSGSINVEIGSTPQCSGSTGVITDVPSDASNSGSAPASN